MGNTVVWKPAGDRGLLRALPDAAPPGGRPAAGRDQPRLRPGRDDRRRRAREPEHLAGVHFTGSTGVFNSMWKTIGANIGELPQLPAHRRRDRRQGLHRRAPVRGRRRRRDGDRPRLVRVPGPEVLGRLARLRAREPLAGAARAARRGGRPDQDGRRRRLRELHGRGHRREARSRRSRRRSTRRARTTRPRSSSAAASTTSEGYFVEPTVIETSDPDFRLLRDELFGPVVTAYVYPEGKWSDTLDLVDRTAPYGLTGRRLRRRPRGARRGAGGAALRGRQLLRQRQADGRRRRPAAVRRRARVGHERQGGLDVEPDPLGQPAHDQGDVRPADGLPLPVHGRPTATGATALGDGPGRRPPGGGRTRARARRIERGGADRRHVAAPTSCSARSKPDRVSARAGNDRIDVAGGGLDRVSCGPGSDLVAADSSDKLSADCEVVSRRISTDPYTGGGASTRPRPSRTASRGARRSSPRSRSPASRAAARGTSASRSRGTRAATGGTACCPRLTVSSHPRGAVLARQRPVRRLRLAARRLADRDARLLRQRVGAPRQPLRGRPPLECPVRSAGRKQSGNTGVMFDKEWIACDNGASSPFRGRCYLSYSDIERSRLADTDLDRWRPHLVGSRWRHPTMRDAAGSSAPSPRPRSPSRFRTGRSSCRSTTTRSRSCGRPTAAPASPRRRRSRRRASAPPRCGRPRSRASKSEPTAA